MAKRTNKDQAAEGFTSARLTKQFLLGLDEGLFLASNTANSEMYPLFAQYITKPGAAREMQWEAVKMAGVDQRTCRVFRSRDGLAGFLARIDTGVR
jgi:hypothetical protein